MKSALKYSKRNSGIGKSVKLAALSGVVASVLVSGSELRAEAGGGAAGGAMGAPGVASRYVIRLQERVRKADEAALRGSQLLADGDYEGAIREFKAALDLLPDAPMTKDRKDAYTRSYANASVKLARQRAEEGRYADAIQLVENVLAPTVDPDNIEAKKLLEQLNDPEYFSPAMTPEYLARVRRVELALKTAQGAMDLGDYDRAETDYFAALNDDKYNEAARRGLEENARHKTNYAKAARNHTRAEFLQQVAISWELPVPSRIRSGIDMGPTQTNSGADQVAYIEDKLKNIMIPSVEFQDTPLKDALLFLQERSVELDIREVDPTKKGLNFILQVDSGGGAAPAAAPAADGGGGGFDDAAGGGGFGGGGGGGAGDAPITLKLSNVPLVTALKYTVSLANLKYKVEPHAVLVIPISTPDNDLFTNVYVVPPTFLSAGGGGDDDGGGAAADPFADDAGGGGTGPRKRKTAKGILIEAGVTFAPGTSAIYQPGSSQLIIRNTQDQIELVEAYIDSIKDKAEKQIYITSKFIEIAQDNTDELGFDWLMGGFNMGGNRVFGSGGTDGNGSATNPGDFPFNAPGSTAPVGGSPLTAGNRSGGFAVATDSIDGLIAAANNVDNNQTGIVKAPGIFGIAGVFTDPQFQVVIRALSQKKGVDLMSAPSIMARSGQRAKIEVIREFIYPTEYDPPEIPNQIGGGGGGGGGGLGGPTGTIPVTPANPTAFETRNTGVTLEVDPVLGADEFTIDLSLSPEVVEFDGFINYGTPIFAGTNGLGQAQLLTTNRILMPIFATRKVTTQVTIWDGQTVAIGGLMREDVQDVEDKVPLFGDLPLVGRLFRSSSEQHLKRNLTIFVKAVIMDPAGARYHIPVSDKDSNAPLDMTVPGLAPRAPVEVIGPVGLGGGFTK
ncbi:MAG: type II and III secretion system protein [Verrucomicrobiales bacterium]|nr:type II and III secretion system protein [Verrucomicrobiales bacterium]